jgi:predicted TIM-barrel fold metal-dependent hydrolase
MAQMDRIVDVDVHHCYERKRDLVPYLPEEFHDRFLGDGGISIGGRQFGNNGGYRGIRADLRGEGDEDSMLVTAGATIDDVRENLLDECDIDVALLTGFGQFLAASSYPDSAYGTALCRAFNDYTIERWLEEDDRFRYSLMVNHSDPQGAVEEIHRNGDHPSVVGVMLAPNATYPFGHEMYDPIHEAAVEHDLTITCHLGGGGGIHSYPPTVAGHPSHYVESRMNRHPTIQAHLISAVFQGTFEKFPDLRFVSLEWGWSWIPSLLWRMDREWERNREELAHLTKAPSEYVKEHVRFNTQPIEEPDSNEQLRLLLDWMDGDQILMYASDFPHWDYDHPDRTLISAPPETRRRIFHENAEEVFALG